MRQASYSTEVLCGKNFVQIDTPVTGQTYLYYWTGGSGPLNCSSSSTWYPVTILLVSLAIPITACNSWNIWSVIPFLRADAVCDAMQYWQLLVTLTATYNNSLVNGSKAPGPIICLSDSQVRFKVAGSWAMAFQKLLIQLIFRVAMMSS